MKLFYNKKIAPLNIIVGAFLIFTAFYISPEGAFAFIVLGAFNIAIGVKALRQ